MSEFVVHPYVASSVPEERKRMMKDLGVEDLEELYADIPEKIRLGRDLEIPGPLSELEIKKHVEEILSRNRTTSELSVFLGGGCWPHYVPAAVEEMVSRSEFLTSYTPYQPETA